jgi:hypothetical protein
VAGAGSRSAAREATAFRARRASARPAIATAATEAAAVPGVEQEGTAGGGPRRGGGAGARIGVGGTDGPWRAGRRPGPGHHARRGRERGDGQHDDAQQNGLVVGAEQPDRERGQGRRAEPDDGVTDRDHG